MSPDELIRSIESTGLLICGPLLDEVELRWPDCGYGEKRRVSVTGEVCFLSVSSAAGELLCFVRGAG